MAKFELLGFLHAGGSIKSKKKVELQTKKPELAFLFFELLSEIGKPEIKKNTKIIVSLKDKKLNDFFEDFGINLPLNKNNLPIKILDSSKKRISFLRGFLEGKSSISVKNKIIKVSGKKEQLEQIKKLLELEGVDARIYKNKTYFSLYIEGKTKCFVFRNKIGFLSKEKNKKLEKILSAI